MLTDISIEPFRGDYEALRDMAYSSWRNEYGLDSFPDFYRPAFLRFLFERIPDKRHLIAAYHGDEIVAFLANLPRKFHYQGQELKGAYSCLLVTRRKWLRRGVGTAVIQSALELNREYHYDFALLTLETGHRSTKLIEKMTEAGSPVEFVKKTHVMARMLDLDRVFASENLKAWERAALRLLRVEHGLAHGSEASVRAYHADDLGACHTLLDAYRETIPLTRIWEPADLARELECPDVSQTLVYEKEGRVKGLINYLTHRHLGKVEEKWAWINHVAFSELDRRERTAFVRQFLRHARAGGCIGAVEWIRNYYPLAPLYRARFFPYFRAVRLMSWTFNPDISLHNIPKVYEVQV